MTPLPSTSYILQSTGTKVMKTARSYEMWKINMEKDEDDSWGRRHVRTKAVPPRNTDNSSQAGKFSMFSSHAARTLIHLPERYSIESHIFMWSEKHHLLSNPISLYVDIRQYEWGDSSIQSKYELAGEREMIAFPWNSLPRVSYHHRPSPRRALPVSRHSTIVASPPQACQSLIRRVFLILQRACMYMMHCGESVETRWSLVIRIWGLAGLRIKLLRVLKADSCVTLTLQTLKLEFPHHKSSRAFNSF